MSSGTASTTQQSGASISSSLTGIVGYPCPPEKDCEPIGQEPQFYENFSKHILKQRIAEYIGGKYTQRYIHNYLEFMVINGMLNNLEYLEFKNLIVAGEQI